MAETLTLVDLRARIAARGFNSVIQMVGGVASEIEPIGITEAELDAWLDRIRSSTVSIVIRREPGRGARWRAFLDRFRYGNALTGIAKARWKPEGRA